MQIKMAQNLENMYRKNAIENARQELYQEQQNKADYIQRITRDNKNYKQEIKDLSAQNTILEKQVRLYLIICIIATIVALIFGICLFYRIEDWFALVFGGIIGWVVCHFIQN